MSVYIIVGIVLLVYTFWLVAWNERRDEFYSSRIASLQAKIDAIADRSFDEEFPECGVEIHDDPYVSPDDSYASLAERDALKADRIADDREALCNCSWCKSHEPNISSE